MCQKVERSELTNILFMWNGATRDSSRMSRVGVCCAWLWVRGFDQNARPHNPRSMVLFANTTCRVRLKRKPLCVGMHMQIFEFEFFGYDGATSYDPMPSAWCRWAMWWYVMGELNVESVHVMGWREVVGTEYELGCAQSSFKSTLSQCRHIHHDPLCKTLFGSI